MSKFKRWYAAAVAVVMVASFGYLRVSSLMQASAAVADPISRTVIDHAAELRSINPDFYGQAQDGDIEEVFSDKVLIIRPSTNQIIIERKK